MRVRRKRLGRAPRGFWFEGKIGSGHTDKSP
jgi:hypothetical protein